MASIRRGGVPSLAAASSKGLPVAPRRGLPLAQPLAELHAPPYLSTDSVHATGAAPHAFSYLSGAERESKMDGDDRDADAGSRRQGRGPGLAGRASRSVHDIAAGGAWAPEQPAGPRRYARRASCETPHLPTPCRVPPVEARAACRGCRQVPSNPSCAEIPLLRSSLRKPHRPSPRSLDPILKHVEEPCSAAGRPRTRDARAGRDRAGPGQQRRLRLSQPAVGRGTGGLWAAACCRAGDTARAESSSPRPRSPRQPSLPPCCNGITTRTGMASRRAQSPRRYRLPNPLLSRPTYGFAARAGRGRQVQSAAASAVPDTGANSEPAVLACRSDPPRDPHLLPVRAGRSRAIKTRSRAVSRLRGRRAPAAAASTRRAASAARHSGAATAPPLPCRCRRALPPRTGGSRLRSVPSTGRDDRGSLAGVVLALAVLYRWVDPPMSTLMLGQRLTGTPIGQRWLPLERISPNLQLRGDPVRGRALLPAPRRRLGGAEEAIEQHRRRICRVAAAPSPCRWSRTSSCGRRSSYLRKALEIPLAYTIELVWPKRRILEIYLNIAEWGPGIFGAEAAARYHFRKSALLLTPAPGRPACGLPAQPLRAPGRQHPGRGCSGSPTTCMLRMRAQPGNAACMRRRMALARGRRLAIGKSLAMRQECRYKPRDLPPGAGQAPGVRCAADFLRQKRVRWPSRGRKCRA